METLVDNPVSVRLCDTNGNNYYLSFMQEVQQEQEKEKEMSKTMTSMAKP